MAIINNAPIYLQIADALMDDILAGRNRAPCAEKLSRKLKICF